MPHHPLRLAVWLLVALAAPLAAAQDATPAELRREIEQLRAENESLLEHNERLSTHNDQLNAQIASMREELEVLRRAQDEATARIAVLEQQANRPAESAPEAKPDRPAETDPSPVKRAEVPEHHLASPASLLNAVRREYQARFPNPPLQTEEEVRAYQDRLARWTREIAQTHRGQARWRVRITDVQRDARGPRGAAARMAVLDPQSGLPIGESFSVVVPPRMALKLSDAPEQYYDLTLMLSPSLNINPDRRQEGVFEWPPFVGPMVEFGFSFEWGGLRPVASAADAPEDGAEPQTPPERP